MSAPPREGSASLPVIEEPCPSPPRVTVDAVRVAHAQPAPIKGLGWWLETTSIQEKMERPARTAARELCDVIETYLGDMCTPFRMSPSALNTFCYLTLTQPETLRHLDFPPAAHARMRVLAQTHLAQTRSREKIIGRLVDIAIQGGAFPIETYKAAEEVFHVDAATIETYRKRYRRSLKKEHEGS